ncbi:MAG: hypothetical protein FWE40_06700 [Oscillospiraceae bacterium]|nr:hypothetical protein [Oscillospiraceae bacterium]
MEEFMNLFGNAINALVAGDSTAIQQINEFIASSRSEQTQTDCDRLQAWAEQYNNHCPEILAKLENEIVREEFASGGEGLHRGWYCPCPIQDLIVTGCHRGRLLKRVTSRSKPRYRYGFNASDELIVAYTMAEFHTIPEIILRQGNTELGFGLRNNQIDTISECVFDEQGRLASYQFATYTANFGIGRHDSFVYHYDEQGLSSFDGFFGDRYHFIRDEEGYLDRFIIRKINRDGESYLPSNWDDSEYPMLRKSIRRVK